MIRCSTCGRELPGVELDAKIEWQCAECAGQTNDTMYCRAGDKAVYIFPEHGSVSSRIMADKHLHVGEAYTVDRIQIHASAIYLHFEESPYWYNSTLFERVAE